MIKDLGNRASLTTLVERQLSLWPRHEAYLQSSFASRNEDSLDFAEEVAGLVLRLIGQVTGGDQLFDDYRYLCEQIVLPEELYFRRNGTYRLHLFADAYREWYSHNDKMSRYMNGLLMSNVFWEPHARALEHYVKVYLARLSLGSEHLEIGPGHGLLLYFAARLEEVKRAVGWDISETSISQTSAMLDALGVRTRVDLQLRDVLAPYLDDRERFDSIVLSEILEHLEDPSRVLRSVRSLLRPGGRVWINVPVNSPAPDHLFLLRSPEEACDLVTAAGFRIVDRAYFPITGSTLERARRDALSISCVLSATRDASNA